MATRHGANALIGAQLMSSLALWLDIFLVFSVPAFAWGATPRDMATLAACLALPGLLLGPVAGALADRVDPKLAACGGAAARAILSLAAAFAPHLPTLAAIVLLKGLANLAYFPAMAVIANRLVDPAHRVGYFSALSLIEQGSKVGTPLLAGLLTLALPSQKIFIVAALAAGLGGAGLMYALHGWLRPPAASPQRPLGLFGDIVQALRRTPHLDLSLRLGLLMSAGVSATLAIYDPHVAAYLAHQRLDPTLFAHIMAATASGAILAAAFVRLRFKTAPLQHLRVAGLGCFCLALSGIAITVHAAPLTLMPRLFLPLWGLNGFGFEMFVLANVVIIQNHSPPDMIGKITSSIRSAQMACAAALPSAGAWLIAHGGREAPFVAAAAMGLGLLALGVLSVMRPGRQGAMSKPSAR